MRQNIVNNMEKIVEVAKISLYEQENHIYNIGSTTEALAPEYDDCIV